MKAPSVTQICIVFFLALLGLAYLGAVLTGIYE